MKVTVVGAGAVGASCAEYIAIKNFASEVVLVDIKEKFAEIGINNENNVVFSCGSGITAAVLSLTYSMINDKYLPKIYDGSWAEYGRVK